MGVIRDFAYSWAAARRERLRQRLSAATASLRGLHGRSSEAASKLRVPHGAPRAFKSAQAGAKLLAAWAAETSARRRAAAVAAAEAARRAGAGARRAAPATRSGTASMHTEPAAAAASNTNTASRRANSLAALEPRYASAFAEFQRPLVIGAVGYSGRAWLTLANTFEAHGVEHFLRALEERPQGSPLLTVSNHVAALDDPLLPSTLVPLDRLLTAGRMRWTLCAEENCFRTAFTQCFFAAGKVVPVRRGEGADQAGMREMRDRLREGEWVHIFPEGTRSRDGGATLRRAKRGVGWLAGEAAKGAAADPVIVPFVHDGMQNIQPRGKAPRTGQTVRVLVGEPVEIGDLLAACRAQRGVASATALASAQMDGSSAVADAALHDAIARRCDRALRVLHARLQTGGEATAGASRWADGAYADIASDAFAPANSSDDHKWAVPWVGSALTGPVWAQTLRECMASLEPHPPFAASVALPQAASVRRASALELLFGAGSATLAQRPLEPPLGVSFSAGVIL